MATTLWSGRWGGIAPSGERHRRSREVISRSGGIMRCKFPSRKNGRLVHCEGLLELDAAYLFELHPGVSKYREQPAALHYPDGGKTRRYTPDFEVGLADGRLVWVEVKPRCSLEQPEVRHRLAMVQAHMRRSERPFLVLADDELRAEPRQSNARTIYQRGKGSVQPERARAAVALCAEKLPLPMHLAEQAFAARGVNVYALLLLGSLTCDLSSPLSSDTLVCLAKDTDDDWLRLSEERDF
jgi:hypothetical protein